MPKPLIIKDGQVFGMLTVISELPAENKSRIFKCLCSCGCECKRTIKALIKKSISSCGCYQKKFNNSPRENQRSENYGYVGTRLYEIWLGMKKRCYNKNSRAYKWYGGKGIIIFDEWKNRFLTFRDWSLKNGYKENLTIDRIDSNKNYEPSNCRWIPFEDQNRNKNNNRKVIFNEKEMCVSEVSRITGKPYTTIIKRLNNGLTLTEALL